MPIGLDRFCRGSRPECEDFTKQWLDEHAEEWEAANADQAKLAVVPERPKVTPAELRRIAAAQLDYAMGEGQFAGRKAGCDKPTEPERPAYDEKAEVAAYLRYVSDMQKHGIKPRLFSAWLENYRAVNKRSRQK